MARRAMPKVKEYRAALQALDGELSDATKHALIAHTRAPGCDLDVNAIAAAAGATSDKWTSGEYGRVGRLLAEQVGLSEKDVAGIWTRAIGVDRRDETTNLVRWVMHPRLAAAVRKMPWGRDPRAEKDWGIAVEHVRAALTDLDRGVEHPFFDSTGYDLVYEGRRYPPKAVFGLAARHASGVTLGPKDFSAGETSKCFRILREAGFEIVPKVAQAPATGGKRYWWVNNKKTYKHEVGGGYLWSPKNNADGSRNQSYEYMTQVRPGDVVFSFANAAIRAVGVATGSAESAPKPIEFGKTGESWGNEGWHVPVDFRELTQPLRTQEVAAELAPTLPDRYSPIRADGKGNQGTYLAAVPDAMVNALQGLLSGQVEAVERKIAWTPDPEAEQQEEEKKLEQRTDIGETQKKQLVNARRGQGVFRSNLEQIEKGCRVTGIKERRHLRASHIKPWVKSSDFEKLDGNNGLLLAPHVDHLFDQGFIGFETDGRMIVSPQLDITVLARWGIDPKKHYGAFGAEQARYLQYHRENRLKK